MREFQGRYLGFAPTDESAICVGEFEMIVGADQVTLRHATGLTLMEETFHVSDFRPMTDEELFPQGRNPSGPAYRGFTPKDFKGIEVIFTVKPKLTEFDVFIRLGDLADMLAPTILWSRRRFVHTTLLKTALAIEGLRTKGGVPRLAYNGRRKENRNS